MAPPYLYPANMAQAQRGYFPAAAQPMGQMQGMGMMRAPQRWNNQGPYAPRGQQPGGPYQQQQMQQQGMQGGQGQGPPQFRPQGPRGMRPPGAMGGPRGMPPGGVPPGMGGQQGIPQQQQQQGQPRLGGGCAPGGFIEILFRWLIDVFGRLIDWLIPCIWLIDLIYCVHWCYKFCWKIVDCFMVFFGLVDWLIDWFSTYRPATLPQGLMCAGSSATRSCYLQRYIPRWAS